MPNNSWKRNRKEDTSDRVCLTFVPASQAYIASLRDAGAFEGTEAPGTTADPPGTGLTGEATRCADGSSIQCDSTTDPVSRLARAVLSMVMHAAKNTFFRHQQLVFRTNRPQKRVLRKKLTLVLSGVLKQGQTTRNWVFY